MTTVIEDQEVDFTIIRNAKSVEVQRVFDSNKKVVAEITVDDKFQHRFPSTSRVSKHLEMMTAQDLSERLTGGSFFFIEDNLIDWRDGQYNGFIHEDETIHQFMNLLGFQDRKQLSFTHQRKRRDDHETDIVLRKVWNDTEIMVPGYQSGGNFKSQLSFLWNPYVKTVNSSFDLVRLICTNGAVGMAPFLNNKIPLMNRWEEHLDIAALQIQNKVTDVVVNRIQQMKTERASVSDCALLEKHAFDRLYSPVEKADGERAMLQNIMDAVSPAHNLGSVYQDSVFHNKNIGAQLPSHLTTLDLFNVATELRTHSGSVVKSTDFSLDKFSNGLLFDYDNKVKVGRYDSSKTSSFSDPEKAYYGVIG